MMPSQSHKMAKHTQTICLSVFGHFLNLALKGLKPKLKSPKFTFGISVYVNPYSITKETHRAVTHLFCYIEPEK